MNKLLLWGGLAASTIVACAAFVGMVWTFISQNPLRFL